MHSRISFRRSFTPLTLRIDAAVAVCVQSFTLWQQAAIEIMRRNNSVIACSRLVYILLFFAHIPFVVNGRKYKAAALLMHGIREVSDHRYSNRRKVVSNTQW